MSIHKTYFYLSFSLRRLYNLLFKKIWQRELILSVFSALNFVNFSFFFKFSLFKFLFEPQWYLLTCAYKRAIYSIIFPYLKHIFIFYLPILDGLFCSNRNNNTTFQDSIIKPKKTQFKTKQIYLKNNYVLLFNFSIRKVYLHSLCFGC